MERYFEDIWHEFRNELSNYIQYKVNNTHDAEDILQEVFVKIYRNLDKLEKISAVRYWLYTITKNTIIDFYKKKKEVLITHDYLIDIEDEVFIEDNMNNEVSECIKNTTFDIPEKYKVVYDLYENKNMKHKEIVKELDISMSASKVRLMRAKELYKKNLKKCCDFEFDRYGNIIDCSAKADIEVNNAVKC